MTNSEMKFASGGWQLRWSVSDMRTFKACPRRYKLSHVDGYRKAGVEAQQLSFGKLLHRGLEIYNIEVWKGNPQRGLEYALLFASVYGPALSNDWGDEGLNNYTQETLERSLVRYADQYGDEEWETATIDGAPAVEIYFEVQLPGTGYSWSGRIDRVVRSKVTGALAIMDHKSTKTTLGSSYFKNYDLDDQIDGYLWAMSTLLGEPVRHFLVDAIQVAVSFTRCMRYDVTRTDAQIAEWLENEKQWLALYQHYRALDIWPYNAASCKFCEFTSLCSAPPDQRAGILDWDFKQKEMVNV